jgi:hypothetical protein
MALNYDLPFFKDVYQLILKIFDYTNHFPREYKFTLGQDLKRDGINLVRSIYRANKSKENETNETLTAPKRNWRYCVSKKNLW